MHCNHQFGSGCSFCDSAQTSGLIEQERCNNVAPRFGVHDDNIDALCNIQIEKFFSKRKLFWFKVKGFISMLYKKINFTFSWLLVVSVGIIYWQDITISQFRKDPVIAQDFVKEHHCEAQVFTVDEGVLKVQYLCNVDGDEK